MTDDPSPTDTILGHVLVPVANVADARRTGAALERYAPERVTVVHVVEKGDGVPDKTPVEQSESIATEAFDAFREFLPAAETELAYRRDVIAGILEVADAIDATAIAFRPRQDSRLKKLLAGDHSSKLVARSDRPVIALPREDSE